MGMELATMIAIGTLALALAAVSITTLVVHLKVVNHWPDRDAKFTADVTWLGADMYERGLERRFANKPRPSIRDLQPIHADDPSFDRYATGLGTQPPAMEDELVMQETDTQ